jgi:hypothetical protein
MHALESPLHLFFFTPQFFYFIKYKMNSIGFPVLLALRFCDYGPLGVCSSGMDDGYIVTKIVFLLALIASLLCWRAASSVRAPRVIICMFVLEFHAD